MWRGVDAQPGDDFKVVRVASMGKIVVSGAAYGIALTEATVVVEASQAPARRTARPTCM
jgi:hypothetical protein